MIQLTDTERAFADSPEGIMRLSHAREGHRLSEAYKGAAARPWTDADESQAVRALATAKARNEIHLGALVADNAAKAHEHSAETDAERKKRQDNLHNGWRQKA